MPAPWSDTVIWWHVYPLGFLGAERELDPDLPVRHRLPRLVDWLEHLTGLGANGLLLGPVFRSSTHGYDTLDHLQVDPRLGDADDLDALIAACHARGIRVALDGVFNHVGREHPLVLDADGDPQRLAEWFRLDDDGRPRSFEGHDILVELDHDRPAVRRYVGEVLEHWLARGVDAWRLDATYRIPPEFWAAVLPAVRERHPESWFVGEMIHGDYADYVARSGIDSVTAYELWQSIRNSIAERNLFELDWTLRRHAELTTAFTPQTFVGNHDVTRIASAVPEELLGHALAVLFVVPGIPSVYAGDEQAFRGVKEERVGGDDAIRPAFPDSPDDLSPLGAPIMRVHQELIGLRRRHPWLVDGVLETAGVANESLTIRVRERGGDESLVLVLDLGADAVAGPGGELLAGSAGATADRVPPRGWAVCAA